MLQHYKAELFLCVQQHQSGIIHDRQGTPQWTLDPPTAVHMPCDQALLAYSMLHLVVLMIFHRMPELCAPVVRHSSRCTMHACCFVVCAAVHAMASKRHLHASTRR